jgi:hypothetical protein
MCCLMFLYEHDTINFYDEESKWRFQMIH